MSLRQIQGRLEGVDLWFSLIQAGFVVLDSAKGLANRTRDAGESSTPRSTRRDARSALGIHDGISFTTPPERTDRERAEAVNWETGEVVYNDEKRRLQRWEMQASARTILQHKRLRQCYRVPTSEVLIWKRATTATYYGGLRVCGMVWACPVCAAKVAERKRLELIAAMDQHRATGGAVLMLTLTVPHSREDEAFSLTDRLLKAFTAFGGGKRSWKALLPGVVGSVRALEVTHGLANGWHPHLHVLAFLEGDVDREHYERVLLDQWAKVTKRHGLADVNEHGLRLDGAEKAGKYATKWGLEDEMTKAHLKQARKGGNRTPWALLADYTQGDKHAGHLFREFFRAFQSRHQLVWSRGLRARFGLGQERTDEQLAAEKVEAADKVFAGLSPEDWKLIRKNDLQGVVLEVARVSGTREAVDLLLSHYRPAKERDARGHGQTAQEGTHDARRDPKTEGEHEQTATQAPGTAGTQAGQERSLWWGDLGDLEDLPEWPAGTTSRGTPPAPGAEAWRALSSWVHARRDDHSPDGLGG